MSLVQFGQNPLRAAAIAAFVDRPLATKTASSGATPLATPGAPGRRVIAWWGDSNALGFSANLANAAGPRIPFQRALDEAGIWFRMVGYHGIGGPNGTGTTWGRFPGVDDAYDALRFNLIDWRSDGYYGYQMQRSAVAVQSINATSNVITANGHGLGSGDLFVLRSTGTLPTVTGLSSVVGTDGTTYLIGWSASATTNTMQIAAYEGGPGLDITDAGSGTITLHYGLADLVPAIFATYDEAPTDIVVFGGTNDASILVDASAANIDATMASRNEALLDAIDAAAPNALRKYRIQVLPIGAPATNQASKQTVITTFNSYLATSVPNRGATWTYVSAAASIGAPSLVAGDGYHLYEHGYRIYGTDTARSVIAACGFGSDDDRAPRDVVRRPQQACVELRATSDNIRIPTGASVAPGSNAYFAAIWVMLFELKSGTNAILQLENPYNTGALISCTSNNLVLYMRSGAPAIPSSSYTARLRPFRWTRLFAFFDPARGAALFQNAQLVQRVSATATAPQASLGWYIGGGGLSSAPGLYQGFLCGHGANLSIEDAYRMAWRDYHRGIDPPGTTAKYLIDDGVGTAITGELEGATNGILTVSTGGWVPAGQYAKPVDAGYRRPRWDGQRRTITAAYTASPNELVRYSAAGGGFTMTLPSAASNDGAEICLVESGSSTNTLTIATTGGETSDLASLSAAGARRVLTATGGAWVSR